VRVTSEGTRRLYWTLASYVLLILSVSGSGYALHSLPTLHSSYRCYAAACPPRLVVSPSVGSEGGLQGSLMVRQRESTAVQIDPYRRMARLVSHS